MNNLSVLTPEVETRFIDLALNDLEFYATKVLGKDKFLPLHKDWILESYKSKEPIYHLQAFRGSRKTTAICEVGLSWYFLQRPHASVLLIRKTQTHSLAISDNLRNILTSNPLYRRIYNKLYHVMPDASNNWGKGSFSMGASFRDINGTQNHSLTPSFTASSLTSSNTGGHYDLIILDDIVTDVDAESEVERENTIKQFHKILSLTKDKVKVIFVSTPYHYKDATHAIEAHIKYTVRDDIEREVISQTKVDELRSLVSSVEWSTQYELEAPANLYGSFVSLQEKILPSLEDYVHLKTIACVDPSGSDHLKSDFTAISVLKVYLHQKKSLLDVSLDMNDFIFTFSGAIYKQSILKHLHDIKGFLQFHKATHILHETNANQIEYAKQLGAVLNDALSTDSYWIETYRERQNKEEKMNQYIQQALPVLYPMDDCKGSPYLNQITDWDEKASHDDAPDSLSNCLRYFIKKLRWNTTENEHDELTKLKASHKKLFSTNKKHGLESAIGANPRGSFTNANSSNR